MNSLPLFLFIWIFLVSFCHSFVFVTGKATDFKRDNNKFTKHDEEKRLFAQTISKSALQPDILAGAAAAVPVVTNSASVVFAKVKICLLLNIVIYLLSYTYMYPPT